MQTVTLTPKQAEALLAIQKWADVLCIAGAYGSAKTSTLVFWQLQAHATFPGHTALVGRMTYPELRDTTIDEFNKWCPPEFILRFPKDDNICYFKNGGKILFRHVNKWAQDLRGVNIGSCALDQAEEIPEEAFIHLLGRMRQDEGPRKMMLSANLEGHNWIYRMFRKDATVLKEPTLSEEGWIKFGGVYKKEVRIKLPDGTDKLVRLGLIESTTFENPHVSADYIAMMLATFPQEFVKRYVYVSWDDTSGLVFHTFDQDIHIIPADFPLPKHFTLHGGLDHGISAPTAFYPWRTHAVQRSRKIREAISVIGPEYYSGEATIAAHSAAILDLKREEFGVRRIDTFCDPSMFYQVLEGKGKKYSPIDEYRRCGLRVPDFLLRPARTNKSDKKINALRELLNIDPDRLHLVTGKPGAPLCYFRSDCPCVIDEIENFKLKRLRMELARKTSITEDAFAPSPVHGIDGNCYAAIHRPIAPAPVKESKRRRIVTESSPAYGEQAAMVA